MSLLGVHAGPARALVERNDLFSASEITELDASITDHRLLRTRHDAPADARASSLGMDEYTPGSCDTDVTVAHRDRPTLISDVPEQVGIAEEHHMHICGRVAVGTVRFPRAVTGQILTVEKTSESLELTAGEIIMLDDEEPVV